MHKILVIDDETAICRTLQMHFRSKGFEIQLAHNADDGIRIAGEWKPHIIILDIKMPHKSGVDALPEFKQISPDSRIIMITAFQDMRSTIEAIKNGADEYIHKPIDLPELDAAVNKSLDYCCNQESKLKLEAVTEIDGNMMVGRSSAMKEIFKTIGLISPSSATVLITGESGTGKELVAKAIHNSSATSDGNFVAVNCAALVETLLESDMFGHEKGAFTGAVTKQRGKFAFSENGTIFLDEIGEMPLSMQAKLLRVLQEKEIIPIGSNEPVKINTRIIAASNCDLKEKVAKAEFREDLYYRLQVVNIHIPPLRERMEDLPSLVNTLLLKTNREFNTSISGISNSAIECLKKYDWPGNVRELENTLVKAATLCQGDHIDINLIPKHICDSGVINSNDEQQATPVLMTLQEVEKSHTLKVLNENNWHKGHVCKALGISRPRLRRLIAQYGLKESSENIGA